MDIMEETKKTSVVDKPEEKEIEILVIEDEEPLRLLFSEMLSNWGFPCRLAANGVDGLKMMREKPNPIILTDLNMPSMNGLEVLRRIKKSWPESEIIVITGHGTMENAVIAMKQGAADFISKPVNFEHLRVVISRSANRVNSLIENKNLRDTNVELQNINQLKDRFINITNHELRTPLTIIKGYHDSLEMPENTPDTTMEGINTIKKTVDDMSELLTQMHHLSALEGTKIVGEVVTVKLKEVFNELGSEFAPLYQKRGVKLNISDHFPVETLNIDRLLLKRALRELLQNALKYTPENKSVYLSIPSFDNDKVILSVRDEGIGIPPEEQQLIFDRFYEAKDSAHHFSSAHAFLGGGLGVGLSIVKEIVEGCGGSIFVESTLDEGSNFTLILPLDEPD